MNLSVDKVFEYVVALLMRRNGYRVGFPGRTLSGRGARHQIDSIGVYPFAAPFTFPLRLIAEAKCWKLDYDGGKIPINVVRNLQAILEDLQQTLPRDRKLRIDESWEENVSCNYHGAIFSTIPFSRPAIEFANAYAIDIIPMDVDYLGNDFVTKLKVLTDVLVRFINQGSTQFRNRGKTVWPTSSMDRLRRAKSLSSLPGNDPARGLLLDIVEYVVFECSHEAGCGRLPEEISNVRDLLFASRLASIDGHVVVFNIPDEHFQSLRRFTAGRFFRRATHPPDEGGAPDPFFPPPDNPSSGDNVSPPNTPYGKVRIRLFSKEDEPFSLERRLKREVVKGEKKGEIVKVILTFEGEDKRGQREPVNAKATIPRELYMQVKSQGRPRKVVVPVDFGCFYYGLILQD